MRFFDRNHSNVAESSAADDLEQTPLGTKGCQLCIYIFTVLLVYGLITLECWHCKFRHISCFIVVLFELFMCQSSLRATRTQ